MTDLGTTETTIKTVNGMTTITDERLVKKIEANRKKQRSRKGRPGISLSPIPGGLRVSNKWKGFGGHP